MAEIYSIPECIARWGNSASVALLDPACKIFSSPAIPGIIGYKHEAKNIIVFGDPLCAPENTTDLMTQFHAEFQDTVKNIIYVAATEKFTQNSLGNLCHAAISIGNEIILDPTKDPRLERGDRASLLRGKCNQAIRNNVLIREYVEGDLQIEKGMIAVGEAWLNGRQGLQIYLHNVDIFAHREHKRFFYAEKDGAVIGVLILTRIGACDGWVISLSMVEKNAPKGTSELLIVSALEILAKEDCHFFAIGTVPTPTVNAIEGLGPIGRLFVRAGYQFATRAFNLTERESYWTKFHPTTQSSYLVLSKPTLGISSALGIMSALNASKK